jgi:hypothetical protein
MMSPLKVTQTRLLVYSSTCLLEFNVTTQVWLTFPHTQFLSSVYLMRACFESKL